MKAITHYLSLINQTHPIQTPFNLNLTYIKRHYNPIQLETNVLKLLLQCIDQCQRVNDIALISGYRSNNEQHELYQQSMIDNGIEYTQKYVAKPSCSEHESGLAIDIGDVIDSIDYIAPQFLYDAKNNQFRQILFDHGFIQRYPSHKTHITGIEHEPWHFRYVGIPHSCYMQQHDLVLEEYINQLKQTSIEHPLIYQNYLIYRMDSIDAYTLHQCDVSDSNDGFYIVTCKIDDAK